MCYSLYLCQATVRQSRTVPAATTAQVSQVAPSAVGLASIKAEWVAKIASLGQEIPRSRNVQSSDLPWCPPWALKQSPSSLQQHKGRRPPPSRCSRMVWRPKLSRQESLRIPKTTFFDWVNKAREAGTMTAAGDILKNRCDSMPRRVAALLDSQGGPTKYWEMTIKEIK